MWARWRRRSLGPRRPALFPEQWGLALVVVLALLGGAVAVWAALHDSPSLFDGWPW